MDVKKIGFDFDKVFVSYPPLIPDFLIDYLYKRKNGKLKYRYPGFYEKQLRIFSHNFIFRPPLTNNIEALKKISTSGNCSLYLISSRFSFLRNKTESWLTRTGIRKNFKAIYFNYQDKQPHIFKDSIIKKERVQDFLDDDLDLLFFLSKNNPNVNFFWINNKKVKQISENIRGIKDIDEYRKKYL